MKLEDATATNICEYALTGRCFRVKLLSRMKCNPMYAVLAVEGISDEIYKVYTWGEEARDKQIGEVFHVKFRRQLIMDDLTRIYGYVMCDENGTVRANATYPDMKPDYTNLYG